MRQLASSVVASFSGVKHFFLPPSISFSSALCLYPVKLVCLYARVLLCECACVCVCLGLVCFHVYLCVQSTHNHFLAPSHRHCYRGCCCCLRKSFFFCNSFENTWSIWLGKSHGFSYAEIDANMLSCLERIAFCMFSNYSCCIHM